MPMVPIGAYPPLPMAQCAALHRLCAALDPPAHMSSRGPLHAMSFSTVHINADHDVASDDSSVFHWCPILDGCGCGAWSASGEVSGESPVS